MFARSSNRLLRPAITSLLLPVLLLLGLFSVGQASASRSICRTDPIVTLSNGETVQLVAAIESDPVYIDSVDYVLHVAAGVTITNIDYWDSDPVHENVTSVNDADPGKVKVDATIDRNSSGPNIKFNVTGTRLGAPSKTAGGDSSKTVKLDLPAPPVKK